MGRRGRRRSGRRRRRPGKSAGAASSRPSGGCDRISGLPDDLLGEILTLLPVKEAARTAALSSRWRRVWCTSPLSFDLHHLLDPPLLRWHVPWFCSSLSDPLPSAFPPLADPILRHEGPVRRVRIDGFDLPELDTRELQSLYGAFESKRIQHLVFTASPNNAILPQALISGGSLASLATLNCNFCSVRVALAHLMNLRVLKLAHLFNFDEDLLAVISALPVLVGLELVYFTPLCDVHLHSKSLQMLGIHCLWGEKALTIHAPNILELQISAASDVGIDVDAILTNLPKLLHLVLSFSDVDSSLLRIRSTSLKSLVLASFVRCTAFIIDTPNLRSLRMEHMGILQKDFDKMLSSIPMLCNLQLIDLHTYCNFKPCFNKFRLSSKYLQYLKIAGASPLKEISIIDAPSLRKLLISQDISRLACVEVIYAPKIEIIETMQLLPHEGKGYGFQWWTFSCRMDRIGGSM